MFAYKASRVVFVAITNFMAVWTRVGTLLLRFRAISIRVRVRLRQCTLNPKP